MKAIIYLIAGFAIGLLIAPERGSEMRKKLMGKLDDAADDTEESFGDAASDLKAAGKHFGVDAENAVEKMA